MTATYPSTPISAVPAVLAPHELNALRDATAEAVSDAEDAARRDARRFDGDDRRQVASSYLSRWFRQLASQRLDSGAALLDERYEARIIRDLLDDMFGLGRLQRLIDTPEISDIMVNGHDRVFVKRRDGSTEEVGPVARSDDELVALVRDAVSRHDLANQLGGHNERSWNKTVPEVNFRLPSGHRLHAIAWVTRRPSITIRRHDFAINRLEHLQARGTIGEPARQLLEAAVKARLNIVVSGGPGGGKTTLLRCLVGAIPQGERLITVEDSYELALSEIPGAHRNLVEGESRKANSEDVGEISMAALVKAGLRQSPDRVIVGEVRGHEVLPMLQAMTQGSDGSMCTVHANSSADTTSRLATFLTLTPERIPIRAANQLIADAVDLVVHVTYRGKGHREISSVREITSMDGDVVLSNEVITTVDNTVVLAGPPLSDRTMQRLERDGGLDAGWLDPRRWGAS